MAVEFVEISRTEFINKYKHLYRFTTVERLKQTLTKSIFSFRNPSDWNDPFEKFYLERVFLIDGKRVNLPAKGKIFAVCLSGTSSSEAYWKVYAPKEDGVRITFDTEKFLTEFLDKVTDATIFIGEIKYQITREFHKISFDTKKLINEISSNKIGEQQIRLMLKKRKAFYYENEVRIIVVPNKIPTDKKAFKTSVKLQSFSKKMTLDPRLENDEAKKLKNYFKDEYLFKVFHSNLYKDLIRKPIELSSSHKVSTKKTK